MMLGFMFEFLNEILSPIISIISLKQVDVLCDNAAVAEDICNDVLQRFTEKVPTF